MRRIVQVCGLIAAAAGIQGAQAQRSAVVLSAASAQAIVEGCRRQAEAAGHSQAVAVLDTAGNPVATLRMDGASPVAMEFATRKARAAGLWGFATADMANVVKAAPGFANAPDVVALPGGLPLYAADGKTLLGGAGASGAAPQDDLACVQAGIRVSGLAAQRAGAPPPPPPPPAPR